MSEEGFELLDGEHAIVPVMFGDAALAARIADAMLDHGVYVTAFSFPVVPREQARIRVQLSARSEEHTSELQSRGHLVCRLLLEKKQNNAAYSLHITTAFT